MSQFTRPDPSPAAILAELVAFPSLPATPNRAIADWIDSYLQSHGVACQRLPGPEGDRENLFATIGPRDKPGYVLSGHMDVVPVEGQIWGSDPFRLTDRNGRLTGRGAVDMKGFLACMLAMVPHFQRQSLRRPIHLAFSYDEEIGCRGVPHLIAALPRLCAPPQACIVGEPSDMHPVLSHKGKHAVEITIHGKAAHSSTPALGENALYPAAELLLLIRDLAAELVEVGPFDARFDPPHATVVAGMLLGGVAVNIIPDKCRITFEVRSIPGDPPERVSARLVEGLEQILTQARAHGQVLNSTHRSLAAYPALPPSTDTALVQQLERLTGKASIASVSYGTEAGCFQAAGIPSIICGPGSITRAHRPDEYIEAQELAACLLFLSQLGADLRS